MKYLKLITMMIFSLISGWCLSENFLNEIIFYFINPESHQTLLNIWFYSSATIEVTTILIFSIALHKKYKTNPK